MTLGFGFCSVLGKTWVLVRFVLAGFGFFPISTVGAGHRRLPRRHISDSRVSPGVSHYSPFSRIDLGQ